MLDQQSSTVIQDANNEKKWKAVNNMQQTFKKNQKIEDDVAAQEAQNKKHELQETAKILKLQMEARQQKDQATKEYDREVKSFLD